MAGIDWPNIFDKIDSVERMLEAATVLSKERQEELLAERALLLAREQKQTDLGAADRLLAIAFVVGDQRFAIEVKHIVEIVGLQQIARVPNAPPFIAGVANVRGRVVTLLDLRRLFGDTREGIVDLKRAIVVSDGQTQVGFLSEEILGTVQYAKHALQPASGGVNWDHYIRGVSDDLVSVLDTAAIINDPKVIIDDES